MNSLNHVHVDKFGWEDDDEIVIGSKAFETKPYSGASDSSLPPKVRKMSPKKRRQWVAIFNSVLSDTGDEGRAFSAAYAGVKETRSIFSRILRLKQTVHTGAMLALYPRPREAEKIALPGYEVPEELHVTLLYLGKVADLTDEQIAYIQATAETVADMYAPMEATIGGIGRFYTTDADGNQAVYGSVDSPSLADIRQALAVQLDGLYATDHGFTPHMTLAYVKPDEPTPVDDWTPVKTNFNSIHLRLGEDEFIYPFMGTREKSIDDIFSSDFWLEFDRQIRKIAYPIFREAFSAGMEMGRYIKPYSEKAEANPEDVLPVFLNVDIETLNNIGDAYVSQYTNTWMQTLAESTRNQLRDAILVARRDGLGIEYVIEKANYLFSPERAKTIAVTETTNLFGAGAVEVYKAAALDEWEWQTVRDPWVDPECESRQNKRYPVSQPFEAAHPRCRCFPRPVTPVSSPNA